jgi:hypothetical protein
MRTERFERTKRWIGGIAYPANKYASSVSAKSLAATLNTLQEVFAE